jgi:hypothetical protein
MARVEVPARTPERTIIPKNVEGWHLAMQLD